MQSLTLTEAEVAATIGMTVEAFRRKRRALHGAGLPRPLPATRVWSRARIVAWIDAGGGEAAPVAPLPVVVDADDVRLWRDQRDARRAAARPAGAAS